MADPVSTTSAPPVAPPPVAPPPSAPPVAPPPPDRLRADDRSLGDLFSELTSETSLLVRQEIALAKTELREEATEAGKNIGFVAAGGAVAYAGLITLLVGLGWLLGELILDAEWLGLLIIGAVVAGIGYALVQKGLAALRQMSPAPDTTIQTLKEDKAWLKNETH